MGLLSRISKIFTPKNGDNVFKMVTMDNENYFVYDGKIYQSDIVRSCLRPYVKALGKCVAKHIYETIDEEGKKNLKVNPDPYMRVLLKKPNPYMTMQKMVEKTAISLKLNGNAFCLIVRDDNGVPRQLYPLPATSAETVWMQDDRLAIRFYFRSGKAITFAYSDLIHLRGDFYEHDILGDSIMQALLPLMECIQTIDRGIVRAIKNSSVIKWLLKLNTGVRDEDISAAAQRFAANYLSATKGEDIGVAATDAKADVKQVEPKDYVPNALIMDREKKRVLEIFNTNEEIIESRETGDVWTAYFEHEIEPDIKQLSEVFTEQLFTQRQQGFGNRIIFEAYNLGLASFKDKMQLQAMVDRGGLTPNEWREAFNMAPVEGGDEIVRRLDTAVVNQIKNLANKIQGKNPENDKKLIDLINRLVEGQ